MTKTVIVLADSGASILDGILVKGSIKNNKEINLGSNEVKTEKTENNTRNF